MSTRIQTLAWLLIGLTTNIAFGQAATNAPREFRVVGYLPDYRAAEFNPDATRGLTDLIVFSAEPTKDGQLSLDRLKAFPWSKVRQFKTQQRVRLILCVGGWDRSQHFAAVATATELRSRFVKSTVQACLDNRLDGVDIDWEHPQNELEQNGYAVLLKDLRDGFQPHGLTLSVTMAAWQKLPRAAFAAVDAIHIMSYDNTGKHSTFETAQADVKSLLEQGAPKEKIVLGVPFYGRHVSKRDTTLTYREIIAKYKPALEIDEVDSIYFNGPRMIRRKTNFALESQLGGVMFWELGQDAEGPQSLLRVIGDAVGVYRK